MELNIRQAKMIVRAKSERVIYDNLNKYNKIAVRELVRSKQLGLYKVLNTVYVVSL